MLMLVRSIQVRLVSAKAERPNHPSRRRDSIRPIRLTVALGLKTIHTRAAELSYVSIFVWNALAWVSHFQQGGGPSHPQRHTALRRCC